MANLLATKRGRLLTFFLLYVSEGLPQGFTMVAIAAYMREQKVPVDQVGAFLALLYLPWSWKWAAGPVVDLVYSERLGRRRGWIVGCQLGMALTLLLAMPIDFTKKLWLFNIVILVHNLFGAVQDVAIDALAVNVLEETERGQGNGLMFAGAFVGQILGGAGVQFLMPRLPSLNPAFVFVALTILAITVGVSLRLREPPTPAVEPDPATADAAGRSRLEKVGAEIWAYLVAAVRSMFASRANIALAVLALFPAGAYALSLTLKQPLGVDLGFKGSGLATFNLVTTLFAAAGCAAGGWLSDKLGRRKALALYVALMSLPNLLLAWALYRYDWVRPVSPTEGQRVPADALVTAFWLAASASALFMGLMYGARSALYMDLSNPAVAGTQFTAYMSLMNLALSYSAWWQGKVAAAWGYPATLLIDAAFGLVCLVVLPFTLPKFAAVAPPGAAEPAVAGPEAEPAK